MSRLITLIVVILTVTGTGTVVNAGRLVQEDPSWNKDETPNEPLFLVPDAPDDDLVVNGLREVRQQMGPIPISTTTTPMPGDEVTTKRNKRFYISSSTSEEPLSKRIRKRISKSELQNHRFMSPGSSDQTKDKTEEMFAISKELDQQILDEEGGNEDEETRIKRQNSIQLWEQYPPHALPLDSYFFKFNLTTPKYPYGKCWVSLGYELNPRCLGGEVCVDRDTGQKIECSLPSTGPGVPPPACPPCPSGGGGGAGGSTNAPATAAPTGSPSPVTPPAQPCPKGCLPGPSKRNLDKNYLSFFTYQTNSQKIM